MNADDWLAQASALRAAGKRAEAVQACRRALAIEPNSPQVHHALTQALRASGEPEAALLAARKCVELAPQVYAAWSTLGVALMELGQLDDSVNCFRRALQLMPKDPATELNLAEALLLKGDFAEAWPHYEACEIVERVAPELPRTRPQWNGEPLNGRTILLYADGGFGDTIMFCRYVPMIRQYGGRVVFACQRELMPLLAQLPGVDQLVPRGEALPQYDVYALLMSLPRLCGTTLQNVPARVPYLHADSGRMEYWHKRLAGVPGRRIGLAWGGRLTHVNDFQRSIDPAQLKPLAAIENVSFISLQKGRPDELPRAVAVPLVDWTNELSDFAETAALMSNLDLVVSVDTSIAHLAGAMGSPAWVLLPFAPDWRWMLQREDSPWYPTLRLIRQKKAQDWDSVIERVAEALRRLQL